MAVAIAAVFLGVRPIPLLAQACALPDSPSNYVQHIVVIMLEDRSFDHLLGWTTATQAQVYQTGDPNTSQTWCSTFPLDSANSPDCAVGSSRNGTPLTLPTSTGTDDSDPDHALSQLAVFYDADGSGNGRADGWLFSLNGDPLNTSHYAIGYYPQNPQLLPYLTGLATGGAISLTTYFAPMIAQTRPNRMYEHAASTDRINQGGCQFGCPPGLYTIWDYDVGGLGTDFPSTPGHKGRYYYGGSNTSEPRDYLTLFWPDRNYVTHPVEQFASDLNAGILAPVTFIDSQHFHPPDDVSAADNWVQQTVEAIRTSSFGPSTVIVITFDDGGGFFDHVVPPKVPSTTYADVLAGQAGGVGPDPNGFVPLGFRVPALIVSPFGASANGSSYQYDHTSVLKMIEWAFLNNWRIPAAPGSGTQPRDSMDESYIANLACAIDFTSSASVAEGGFNRR